MAARTLATQAVSEERDVGDKKETVTPSCGCVFCDLKLLPTHCTDGWFHLLSDGRTIPCPIAK